MDISNNRLLVLKKQGFIPDFILDVGAGVGKWSKMIKGIFPTSDIFMIDANQDNAKLLATIGFPFKICLLGNNVGLSTYYCIKNGINIRNSGNSIFLENTENFKNGNYKEKTLPMDTIDNAVNESLYKNKKCLLKIDTQGAEKIILEGSKKFLKYCEFVLLEVPIIEYNIGSPNFLEVCTYMDVIGFQPYDVLEMHYLTSEVMCQIDILFVKKTSQYILRKNLK